MTTKRRATLLIFLLRVLWRPKIAVKSQMIKFQKGNPATGGLLALIQLKAKRKRRIFTTLQLLLEIRSSSLIQAMMDSLVLTQVRRDPNLVQKLKFIPIIQHLELYWRRSRLNQ